MRKVIVDALDDNTGNHLYFEGVVAESESNIDYDGKELEGYKVNPSDAWIEYKTGEKHSLPNFAGFIAGCNDSTDVNDYFYIMDTVKDTKWVHLPKEYTGCEISNYETSNAAESFAESSRRVVEAGTAIYDAMASGKNVMEPTIRYAVIDQWDYSSVILEL